MRYRNWILAVAVLAAIALVGFGRTLVPLALAQGIGFATQTKISYDAAAYSARAMNLTNVHVRSRSGEPIAEISHVDVGYDLRDLLPGSQRRFGLGSIDVDRPVVTIVRHRDGTYNVPIPSGGNPPQYTPQAAPFNFTARLRNGSVSVLDEGRTDPRRRYLYLEAMNGDASFNTAHRSWYSVHLVYREGKQRYPITGVARIDADQGAMMHHWSAAKIPLPQILEYAINSPAVSVQSGTLERLEARYFGVTDANGGMQGRLSAQAFLNGMRVGISGIPRPIRDLHGDLTVTQHGLLAQRLDATIAGVPVVITGGIINLSKPQLRLTAAGAGDAAALATLTGKQLPQPLEGNVAFRVRVEGAPQRPLSFVAFNAPRARYGGMPFQTTRGVAAIGSKDAQLFGFTTRYAGIDVNGRGRIAFGREPGAIEVLARAGALSDSVPYAAALVHGVPLDATVLATADDPKQVQTQGFISGASAAQRVAAVFRVNSAGAGDVYPLEVTRGTHSLTGSVAIDRPNGNIDGVLHAHDFALLPAGTVALAGLHVPSLPVVRGTLNGDVYGAQRRGAVALLGALNMRGVRVNQLSVEQARVAFRDDRTGRSVTEIHAHGPWGTLDAGGAVAANNAVAMRGTYAGSLSALSSLGIRTGGTGNVRAPISMIYDGNTVIAQVDRARFSGASLQHVPLQNASATVALRPGRVRVYAAVAKIAKRAQVLASGSVGNRNNLAVSVADFDLASLGAMAGPLQSGNASAAATVAGTLSAPRVRGAAMLRDADLRNMPLSASTSFAYGSDALALNAASVAVGPAFGTIDGSIAGLNPASLQPRFDLLADVRGADAHALTAAFNPGAARDIQGTVSAHVAVRGTTRAPSFDGSVSAPEGSLHGLAFRDMTARVSGSPASVALRGGHVVVGTTAVAFSGSAAARGFAGSIDAPRADLADFNDFFDAADTLGGRGSLQVALSDYAGAIASTGAVSLDNARYRRIDVGRTVARWHQSGNGIAGIADVRGSGGTLAVNGSLHLPATRNLATAFRTASVNGTAQIRNLDLRTWLPVAGIQAPVTGFVHGDAQISGAFPDVTLHTNAALADGTFGRVAVRRFTVAADVARGHGTIRNATVQIPNLTANATGTFGLHRRDPLGVNMRVTSPDVAAVANEVTGRTFDGAGALDMNAQLRGTAANPHLRDAVALTSLRYKNFNVPSVTGIVDADTKNVALSSGEIAFQRGSIALSGHTALRANAPLSVMMTARDLEALNFASLFSEGTKIGGRLDGTVAVSGTQHAPEFNGMLALANGSFSGPDELSPITHANAQLLFAGRTVALRNAGANVGGGTVAAQGTGSVPDLRNANAATFRVAATANHAQLNMPKYMKGEVDANVWAARKPASNIALGGNVTIPSARVPLSLFYNPNAPQGPSVAPPPVAFHLHVNVGNDVRVQSPNVDVGAQGAIAVAGTLAQPQLSGELTSTGGTVDFFRSFRVQSGTLTFNPSNGVMPMVDAVATTTIENPMTDIALRVTGLAPSNLNVAFNSDPSYSREQILGLLVNAQAIGAVSGVQTASTTGTGFSASGELQNLAMGQINTLFTRNLLEPFSAQFGNALGLQNFQLAGDFRGGFGLNAAKVFGKNLTAQFSENLGSPKRQSVDLRATGKNSTAIDLMLYAAENPNSAGFFASNPFANLNAMGNSTMPAMTGTNGFSLTYGHQFQ